MTREQVDNPKAPVLTPIIFVHSHDLDATLQHTSCQHPVWEDSCQRFHREHISYSLHLTHARLPGGVPLVCLDGCQPSWTWHRQW